MQCWHDSGIPAGVIHCLQGNAESGKALLAQDIQGVYFTGSYPTGLRIHQQFANRPDIILALEMGGNNPLVVDEVKNSDAAIYNTLLSTLLTSGQRCTCARRVMIPNSAFGDAFLERFIHLCSELHIGPYDQKPEPFMGPVISHLQALRHLHAQKLLIDAGGVPLLQMELMKEYTGLLSPGIIEMTAVPNPPDEEFLLLLFKYIATNSLMRRLN